MADDLDAMLLARLFEPVPIYDLVRKRRPQGDIGVAPPRQPRRGLFDPQPFPGARAGFAEEWQGQPPAGEDDSPSDRPPPPALGGGMPPALGAAVLRGQPPGQPLGPPPAPEAAQGGVAVPSWNLPPDPEDMRGNIQMLGKWPLRQMAGRLGAAQDDEGNAKLAEIEAAKKNPQDFGPEGMRPDMARMISAPPPVKPEPEKPAGWLEMRAKHLGGAAPPPSGEMFTHDENAKILADIHHELNGLPREQSPVDRVKAGWKSKGLDDASAQAKADQWAAQQAMSDAKEKARFEGLGESHARLAEHQLFRDNPQTWSMWKMMNGGMGGAGGEEGGEGGMGADALVKLAALNQQQGFSEGANRALQAAKIKSDQAQAEGSLAMADLHHYREAQNIYQQRREQFAIALSQAKETARTRLAAGKPDYVPSKEAIEADIKKNSPELLISPVPPIPPAVRGRRGAAPPVLGPPPADPALPPPPAPQGDISDRADTLRQKFTVTPQDKHPSLVVEHLDDLSGMGEDELRHVAASPGFAAALKTARDIGPAEAMKWWQIMGNFPGTEKITREFWMKRYREKINKLANRLGYKW